MLIASSVIPLLFFYFFVLWFHFSPILLRFSHFSFSFLLCLLSLALPSFPPSFHATMYITDKYVYTDIHTRVHIQAQVYTCAPSGTLSVNVRDTVRYIFLQNWSFFVQASSYDCIHISDGGVSRNSIMAILDNWLLNGYEIYDKLIHSSMS